MQIAVENKIETKLSKKAKKLHQNSACFAAFAGGFWTVPVFFLVHFAADEYGFPRGFTFLVVFSFFSAAFLTTYPLMFVVFYLYEKLNTEENEGSDRAHG